MNDTLKVGFVGFCYVLILGLILQLLIIPATSLHAGDGLLKGGDWIAFHQIAIELAEKIEQNSWHMWRLRPEGQAPAGVAALLYVITGVYQPWILLLVNAFLFAVSTSCLYLILRIFTNSRNEALLATLPLFLLPSLAIVWGQLHKDIYVLAGLFLVLVFWSRIIAMGSLRIFEILICIVGGNCLIFLVRPYALKILLLSQLLVFILLIFNSSIVKSVKLFLQGALALFFTLFVIYATKTMNQEIPGAEDISRYACTQWRYTLSNASLDETFARLACYREMWIEKSVFAASNVDSDIHFEAAFDVIAYIPRAVQVGMFAPFPNDWSMLNISDLKSGLFKLVGVIETLLLYVSYVLLAFLLLDSQALRSRQKVVLSCLLVFLISWVSVYALTAGNVGTIYRIRHPLMVVCMGLGVLGLLALFRKGGCD